MLEEISQNFTRTRINDHEIIDLVSYAVEQNFNISFIEQMPLGEIGYDRSTSFINSNEAKKIIEKKYFLEENNKRTGGPAVYWKIKEQSAWGESSCVRH